MALEMGMDCTQRTKDIDLLLSLLFCSSLGSIYDRLDNYSASIHLQLEYIHRFINLTTSIATSIRIVSHRMGSNTTLSGSIERLSKSQMRARRSKVPKKGVKAEAAAEPAATKTVQVGGKNNGGHRAVATVKAPKYYENTAATKQKVGWRIYGTRAAGILHCVQWEFADIYFLLVCIRSHERLPPPPSYAAPSLQEAYSSYSLADSVASELSSSSNCLQDYSSSLDLTRSTVSH